MTYFSNPTLTDWHRQIIVGTILGGSSIVKPKQGRNCYLFMRSANRNWINYKALELTDLASERPFTYEKNTARWHSNCYPIFLEYYNMFYENGKKVVKMSILDTLRDIGLATWCGDCGKLKKNKLILNTNKFGEDGTKIISDYFREVGVGETTLTKERKYVRLTFTPESTEKFMLIIADRLPEFMQDKLLLR